MEEETFITGTQYSVHFVSGSLNISDTNNFHYQGSSEENKQLIFPLIG